MINLIKTRLKFDNKENSLRFHLLAMFTEENLQLSVADINVAIEVYLYGYTKDLFKNCVEKKYFRSEQTVRNSIAKLTKLGILIKSKNNRKLNSKYLPNKSGDDFVFDYQVFYEIDKQKQALSV